MAVTLRTKQRIRGMTAIAERPDGTRVNFLPFPTPLFGPTRVLVGAVNILIDVTESRQITDLEVPGCAVPSLGKLTWRARPLLWKKLQARSGTSKSRNFFARIEQRWKERHTTSLYADDKIRDDFEVPLSRPNRPPSMLLWKKLGSSTPRRGRSWSGSEALTALTRRRRKTEQHEAWDPGGLGFSSPGLRLRSK